MMLCTSGVINLKKRKKESLKGMVFKLDVKISRTAMGSRVGGGKGFQQIGSRRKSRVYLQGKWTGVACGKVSGGGGGL